MRSIDEGFVQAAVAEMKRQRMGVSCLASSTRIPERTLRHILTDRQHVKLWQVCEIAAALGLACSELVSRATRRMRVARQNREAS